MTSYIPSQNIVSWQKQSIGTATNSVWTSYQTRPLSYLLPVWPHSEKHQLINQKKRKTKTKTMLKILCNLLRKDQRGIIFTAHCNSSWIIFLIFLLFSSSHTWHLLLKLSAPPFQTLTTSQLCCCFSPSSPAQRVLYYVDLQKMFSFTPSHKYSGKEWQQRTLPVCCA